MEKFDALSQMKQLVKELNENTIAYDRGVPVWTDKQWDDKYFELVELERKYPSLILEDSPTQHITCMIMPELVKVQHEYQPMLSLAKTKDINEVKAFIGGRQWIAMLKLDGLTCRLTYEEGRLVRAETRGNGLEGEDITHNALVLPSIPKKISYKDTLVVDGEVVCDLVNFMKFKDYYANARNFASGSIRLLNSQECKSRGLTFVAWDVIKGYEADADTTLNKRLTRLIDYGFDIVPFTTLDFDNCIEHLKEGNDVYDYYPIDGIVFKWNNCAEYEAAGRTDHHFRGGLAYKFYDDEYETTLKDIEWSMGRTGVLTPVAVYEDINIDGAICNRANLHNLNIITDLFGSAVLKGQKIWVYKANQIIPQISRVQPAEEILGVDPAYFFNDDEVEFINPPHNCPICGAETEVRVAESGTTEVYCTNDNCEGKLINKLDHFCGKKGLDIKHLSKATLEKLVDWGWVEKARDLFYLYQRRKEWINKPGFGEKSVDRILAAIEDARHCEFSDFIAALGIPLIGKTYARAIAAEFANYNEFRDNIMGGFNFATINGFGPAMHEALVAFDFTEADIMVDRSFIDFKTRDSVPDNFGNPLEGLTFVITGKLKNYKNRDLLKAEIEARGGKVVGSVSSKTSYLVNNDINSTSSKNKTAQQLGVKIITEEELLALWQ